MSLVLYAEPVKPPEPTNLGGHPLKGLICKAFGDWDGSLKEEIILVRENLPEIELLLRLEENPEVIAGLDIIRSMIVDHGVVRLWTDE